MYIQATGEAGELSGVSYFLKQYKRVGTLIVVTIYLQLIQNRYMFRSFTALQIWDRER